jgi:Flp pilus assembly protein TadD
LELNQFKEAITSFNEAIRINPDNPKTHGVLGRAYQQLGRNNKAIIYYKKALRIDPNELYSRIYLNKLEQKVSEEKLADEQRLLEEERTKHQTLQNIKEADRLARERKLLEKERKKLEALVGDNEK